MGGHITYHDYICKKGTVTEFGNQPSDIKRTIDCPCCGESAEQYYGTKRQMCRWNFSGCRPGSYGSPGLMYGRVDPQTGVAFENYSHKKKWLRDHNMEETGDTVHGSRTSFDVDEPERQAGGDILRANSVEEITRLIDKKQIDREHSGPNVNNNLEVSDNLGDSGYSME